MRILLISDSHSVLVNEDFTKYDLVLHCGDYGISKSVLDNNHVKYVIGNCDDYGEYEYIFTFNGRKIFMAHGHQYGVKMGYDRIKYRALENGCSILVFGHTHIPIWQPEDDLLTMNPGAYMDGFKIEITDDYIYYILDQRIYKKFEFKW